MRADDSLILAASKKFARETRVTVQALEECSVSSDLESYTHFQNSFPALTPHLTSTSLVAIISSGQSVDESLKLILQAHLQIV